MSNEARPITSESFSKALTELSVANIFAKASELNNSIAHLKLSNVQLREFANQGDKECADAVKENDEVIQSMEHRVLLCQFEVEQNRGMKWDEDKDSNAKNVKEAAEERGVFL
jgi:hypothetical protein